jgi:hypothetical protein
MRDIAWSQRACEVCSVEQRSALALLQQVYLLYVMEKNVESCAKSANTTVQHKEQYTET